MTEQDGCVDNYRLIFDPTLVDFDQAAALCKDQYRGRLAIPSSNKRFTRMLAFHQRNGGSAAWVGLRDFNQEGGMLDAKRFQSIGRNNNPFTFVASESPWESGEPNNVKGVEHCVEARTPSGKLNDKRCTSKIGFLCEVYCGVKPENFIVGECVGDVQFYLNPNYRNAEAAIADCEAFDPEGKLAIPSDTNMFETMQEVFKASNTTSSTWIGLRDFEEVGGSTTARFLSMEGEKLDFIDVGRSNFPWHHNQPNDDDIQNCVCIVGDPSRLNDFNCKYSLHSICQRPCQKDDLTTLTPTTSPTLIFTDNPTNSPSKNPTISPTESPKLSPTFATEVPLVKIKP